MENVTNRRAAESLLELRKRKQDRKKEMLIDSLLCVTPRWQILIDWVGLDLNRIIPGWHDLYLIVWLHDFTSETIIICSVVILMSSYLVQGWKDCNFFDSLAEIVNFFLSGSPHHWFSKTFYASNHPFINIWLKNLNILTLSAVFSVFGLEHPLIECHHHQRNDNTV